MVKCGLSPHLNNVKNYRTGGVTQYPSHTDTGVGVEPTTYRVKVCWHYQIRPSGISMTKIKIHTPWWGI